MKRTIPFLVVIVLATATMARAAEPAAAAPLKGMDAYRNRQTAWRPKLEDRLMLGTRLTPAVLLRPTSSDGFLGTIVKLNLQEDFVPWKLFAAYQFTPRWGVELTWDQVVADAVTRASDQHIDGDFELTGPILSAVYRLEKRGRFQPYGQVGFGWMKGNFDPARWWELGYDKESDWIMLGSPREPRNSITRDIRVDDAPAVVAAAGSRIEIARHWSGDVFLRGMYLETESQFTEMRKGKPIKGVGEVSSIPFSNVALGLGVAYTF